MASVCATDKQQTKQRNQRADRAPSVDSYLERFTEDDLSRSEGEQQVRYTWDDYLAPNALKDNLRRIGEDLDIEHLKRKCQARKIQTGEANRKSPKIPILLIHGPPGTGKSFAMRVLAEQSGLQAFKLKVKMLQEESWEPQTLFKQLLERMSSLENAIIYVDECELLFPQRAAMANYQSLEVRGHQKMIAEFLEWADGLETKRLAQPPLLCLATNFLEQLDPAIRSRANTILYNGLPSAAQCTEWWSLSARHHSGQRLGFPIRKAAALGWLSWAAGHDFRKMDSIREKMVSIQAEKMKDHPMVRAQELAPRFEDYVREIFQEACQRLPNFLEALQQIPSGVWTLSSLLLLLDRARFCMPRARL